MSKDQFAVITVEHVCKDGWHTFTCYEVPGFYLISTEPDLEAAYAEVPESIAEIIESDTGVSTEVELENSYSEYLAKLPDGMRPTKRHYSVKRAA
jgi:hypothetical protein